jgi:hypothetical protein
VRFAILQYSTILFILLIAVELIQPLLSTTAIILCLSWYYRSELPYGNHFIQPTFFAPTCVSNSHTRHTNNIANRLQSDRFKQLPAIFQHSAFGYATFDAKCLPEHEIFRPFIHTHLRHDIERHRFGSTSLEEKEKRLLDLLDCSNESRRCASSLRLVMALINPRYSHTRIVLIPTPKKFLLQLSQVDSLFI